LLPAVETWGRVTQLLSDSVQALKITEITRNQRSDDCREIFIIARQAKSKIERVISVDMTSPNKRKGVLCGQT